jgi:hypothetical protein
MLPLLLLLLLQGRLHIIQCRLSSVGRQERLRLCWQGTRLLTQRLITIAEQPSTEDVQGSPSSSLQALRVQRTQKNLVDAIYLITLCMWCECLILSAGSS